MIKWLGGLFCYPFLHFLTHKPLLTFPHSPQTDDMRKYLQKKEAPTASLPASSSPSPAPTDAPNGAATATDGTAAGASSSTPSSTTTTATTSGKKKRQQSVGVDLTAEDVTENLGKMNLEGGGWAGDKEANGTEDKP